MAERPPPGQPPPPEEGPSPEEGPPPTADWPPADGEPPRPEPASAGTGGSPRRTTAATARTLFVTGGTGFIGRRLVARLLQRGDRVRCLVRDPATPAAAALRAAGAELVEGDATALATLARHIRGADVAYHLAAVYDIGIVREEVLEDVNVGGTRHFLAAARGAEVPHAVYVSSTVALGPAPTGADGDERSAWDGPFPSVYHRTKTEAHHLAAAAQAAGQPLTLVCPANVYGPEDDGPNGRFIRDLVRGRLPALVRHPATFSYVFVEDVADGLVAAGDAPRGGTYVLGGESATLNEFAERVCAAAERRAPRLRMPVGLVRATARLTDAVSRVTPLRLPITVEGVDVTTGARWVHSYARATDELGYAPRPLAAGIPVTAAWALVAEAGKRR